MEDKKQTDKELKATLDMWETMEENQRLEQLKYLLEEWNQKGTVKIEDLKRLIERIKEPLVEFGKPNAFMIDYDKLKIELKKLGDKNGR